MWPQASLFSVETPVTYLWHEHEVRWLQKSLLGLQGRAGIGCPWRHWGPMQFPGHLPQFSQESGNSLHKQREWTWLFGFTKRSNDGSHREQVSDQDVDWLKEDKASSGNEHPITGVCEQSVDEPEAKFYILPLQSSYCIVIACFLHWLPDWTTRYPSV